MVAPLLAIVGLAVGCGLWVVVQRWIARRDPGQPGVEGKCGSCGTDACTPRDKPPRIR